MATRQAFARARPVRGSLPACQRAFCSAGDTTDRPVPSPRSGRWACRDSTHRRQQPAGARRSIPNGLVGEHEEELEHDRPLSPTIPASATANVRSHGTLVPPEVNIAAGTSTPGVSVSLRATGKPMRAKGRPFGAVQDHPVTEETMDWLRKKVGRVAVKPAGMCGRTSSVQATCRGWLLLDSSHALTLTSREQSLPRHPDRLRSTRPP